MASSDNQGLIKEGDKVVVRKEKNMKVVPVRKNSKLWIERSKFFLDTAIGHSFGSSFEVVGQKLVKLDKLPAEGDLDLAEEEDDTTKDNRHLKDTSDNQKLSSDEIRNMRKVGVHGEEIVEQLIQNSATFNKKNEFARQKYIKKKKKKYMPIITVLRPTARLLLEMYYNKGPSRICNLRVDSLAQLLSQANVRAGNKMLVVESCVGLVVGAVMERMGGKGSIIQFYSGSAPVQQAFESFDFPKEYDDKLYSYPLCRVNKLRRPCDDSTEGPSEIQQAEAMEYQSEQADKEDMEDDKQEEADLVERGDSGADSCTNCDTSQQDHGLKRKYQGPSEEEREKRRQTKRKYENDVKNMIEAADSDGLVVVTKYHPTPIVMSLIDFVTPSRPIAVFCQYKEPLMDCYVQLRDRGGVMLLKLTETWLRGYQVLPNRTHPTINMNGCGGYLLTGTTVALD